MKLLKWVTQINYMMSNEQISLALTAVTFPTFTRHGNTEYQSSGFRYANATLHCHSQVGDATVIMGKKYRMI